MDQDRLDQLYRVCTVAVDLARPGGVTIGQAVELAAKQCGVTLSTDERNRMMLATVRASFALDAAGIE